MAKWHSEGDIMTIKALKWVKGGTFHLCNTMKMKP